MADQRLSENLINICIVPKRARWPERGATAAWAKAHDCVDALQDLVRAADLECLPIEQSRELSADAIRKRRAVICEAALSRLSNFGPLEIAEKALTESVDALERLSERNQKQVEMHKTLRRALRDLPEGVEATKRMALKRGVGCASTLRSNLVDVARPSLLNAAGKQHTELVVQMDAGTVLDLRS